MQIAKISLFTLGLAANSRYFCSRLTSFIKGYWHYKQKSQPIRVEHLTCQTSASLIAVILRLNRILLTFSANPKEYSHVY